MASGIVGFPGKDNGGVLIFTLIFALIHAMRDDDKDYGKDKEGAHGSLCCAQHKLPCAHKEDCRLLEVALKSFLE
jgi:hypothetical protein